MNSRSIVKLNILGMCFNLWVFQFDLKHSWLQKKVDGRPSFTQIGHFIFAGVLQATHSTIFVELQKRLDLRDLQTKYGINTGHSFKASSVSISSSWSSKYSQINSKRFILYFISIFKYFYFGSINLWFVH